MEDPLLLSHPPSNPTSSPPLSTIVARLSSFLLLLSLALYANHEASKTFDITVLDPASSSNSPAARRFHLLFVSNGRASRAIHVSSSHIQKILYPNTTLYPPKPVRHVILQLATHDLPEPVMVGPGSEPGESVVSLSPSVVMERDARGAVERAVRRGMALVWVWDGEGTAPVRVVDAVVKALSGSGTGGDPVCWAELNREMMRKGLSTGILRRLCADNDLSTSAETGHLSWHVD